MTPLWVVLAPSLVALTGFSFAVRFVRSYLGGGIR